MKTLISGALALVIGVPCLGIFLPSLGNFLAGTLPILLILGGGLAVYLGIDEIRADKETYMDETSDPRPHPVPEPVHTESQEAGDNAESETAESKVSNQAPDKEDTENIPNDSVSGLIGNTSSLVFHRPDCNFAQSPNCTQTFASAQEALEQGYKPCKICQP